MIRRWIVSSRLRGEASSKCQRKDLHQCATVSPATHLKVEKRARKVGQNLETCMASSITQARQGTLYLMCGGDRRIYKRVEPLLKDLSASIRYIGASGKASEVKALVNMVMNINTAAGGGSGLGSCAGP